MISEEQIRRFPRRKQKAIRREILKRLTLGYKLRHLVLDSKIGRVDLDRDQVDHDAFCKAYGRPLELLEPPRDKRKPWLGWRYMLFGSGTEGKLRKRNRHF